MIADAMAVSPGYLNYVLEQLAGLGAVSARRMFGGVGLYSGGLFFGLIDDDVLFLRADDSNRGDFEARHMPAFQPFKDKPEYSMSYYQPPADVLEDPEALVAWARKSVAVAAKPSTKKPKKKRG
jgi:DNA transformation protein and related proteins